MPRRVLLPLLALPIVLVACAVDLPLRKDVEIACENDDQCPGGLVCNPTVGRCRASRDDIAPSLAGNATAAPERLSQNATLAVSFTVSEALREDPMVTVDVGGSFAPLTLDDGNTDRAAQRYAFRYLPAGTETEGRTSLINIDLTDAVGNRAIGLAGGAVTFDFTAPRVGLATIAYVPASDNPLAVVDRAKVGTQIIAVVYANEPLLTTNEPTMTSHAGTVELAFELIAGSFTSAGAAFIATVQDIHPEGDYTPTLNWTDTAGNENDQATFAEPMINVKKTPPTIEVDPELVTFLRSPWGDAADEASVLPALAPAPHFELAPADPFGNDASIPAAAFSADVDLAMARIWADALRNSLVGTLRPNTDGTWPRRRLANLDVPQLFVTGVDDAGNESGPEPVERSVWIATPNPPSFGTSPHTLEATAFVVASQAQDREVSQPAESSAEGADGFATRAKASVVWRERLASATTPVARSDHVMAYDNRRGVLVMFGGRDIAFYDDTWEWSDGRWIDPMAPRPYPDVRRIPAMVFDSQRGVSVLFGGNDGNIELDDLWEWDGTAWTERLPAGPRPTARDCTAMAYDSRRGVTVLFGGYQTGGTYMQDTWEWDGTAWAQITPQGDVPPRRECHAVAFDHQRGVVVMFGGFDYPSSVSTLRQDTWEWDGAIWVEKMSGGATPRARRRHALAYDAARGVTVLFGGRNDLGNVTQETWTWNGSNWVAAAPTGPVPDARQFQALAYDSARERVVLYGGHDANGDRLGDIWDWDGTEWTDRTESGVAPVARVEHGLVFESDSGTALLFGGERWDDTLLQDTWRWNGTTWREVTPVTYNPSPRESHAIAFDSGRGVAVLFGGWDGVDTLADTWEWSAGAWTPVTPDPDISSGRDSARMVYDSDRRVTVLFGGYDGAAPTDDTWEWDGTSWLEAIPSGDRPPARYLHGLAYDSGRQVVVMFGGYGNAGILGDTWEWDGSQWSQPPALAVKPSARHNPALAYDAARTVTVLFGGWDDETHPMDMWEWDGSAWTERLLSGAVPIGRDGQRMVFDTARQRTVLFGGFDGFISIGDTWELDASEARRPALTFGVSLGVAGVGADQITSLRVRALCGGTFFPHDGTGLGAALYGWSTGLGGGVPGNWVLLESNGAGMNATQPWLPAPDGALIDWSPATPGELRRYLSSGAHPSPFQCRAGGPSGASATEAQVALDFIEVRVGYRIPQELRGQDVNN